jgi:hypothetical protein
MGLSMHDRCASCGRTEDGVVPLYACRCGRTACREHHLEGGGCALCAPQTFEQRERDRKRTSGISWAEARPRVWGLIGLGLCALAAYTILERGAPRIYLALVAALSLAALFRVMPAK